MHLNNIKLPLELAGFDFQYIASLLNNPNLVGRLLKTLSQDCEHCSRTLQLAIVQRDRTAALQQIHSLKGSASTLGAKNLALATTKLEDQLLAGAVDPDIYEAFLIALVETQVDILRYLQTEEANQSSPVETPLTNLTNISAAPLAPFAILLVEDNSLVQTTLLEVLARAGASVDSAQDGQEALDLLQKRAYDAVLMDLHMPVLDGIQTSQRIRAQKQFMQLPIIGLGAGPVAQEKALCLAHGMNDFISKNTKTADMVAVLAYWLKSDSNKLETNSTAN